MILALSILVGVVIAVALFRLFFKDLADFLECVRFYLTPNIISMFRGQLADDWWGSTKLGVWIAVSVGMAFVAHYKFEQFFPPSDAQTVAAREAKEDLEHDEPNVAEPASKVAAVITNSVPSLATTSASGSYSNRYRIKVGDTVEIAALNPAIALRKATITAIEDEQITVKTSFDEYKVRWKDLTKLKTAGK